MNILLLLVVLLLLFGGGGFYFGGPVIGGSGVGLLLMICLVVWIPLLHAFLPLGKESDRFIGSSRFIA